MNIPQQVKRHLQAEEFDQAIPLLEPLAEQGDADAQFLLGYLHFTSAEVDPEWAKAWLQKAAAQDHPEACYELANWRDDDTFKPPDTEAGWQLLHKAAELGSSEAQYDLGAIYATGSEGFPIDAEKSRGYYTLAARQGNLDAQYNLGLMWLCGEGGPVDVGQGLYWLTLAGSREEPDAMSTFAAEKLADVYEHGRYGIEPDPEQAEYWRRRAIELEQWPFRDYPDWFYAEQTG